ncbi:MAG: polysaccharide deacetylase family protein [Clostridia bacterium]|nr:polysaccharide deacetylase family protein [Clostridia bacterium]
MQSKLISCLSLILALFLFTACESGVEINSKSSGLLEEESAVVTEDNILETPSSSGINPVDPNPEAYLSSGNTAAPEATDPVLSGITLPDPNSSGQAPPSQVQINANPDLNSLNGLDTTRKDWGPGLNMDENNRPVGSTSYQDLYGKYQAWFIGENQPQVYLTFDNGYENGCTTPILDTLKEKNCPAIFFVTLSYVKNNPELIQRMIAEGHTLGNHTANHPEMPNISLEKQIAEIMELHNYLKENYNYDMYLFRYPAGVFNEQSLALLQKMGYQSVFWSFAYKDWLTDDQPDPTESLDLLNKRMHPGAIYLLHAVSQTNTQILGSFIDQTRQSGYQFAQFTP